MTLFEVDKQNNLVKIEVKESLFPKDVIIDASYSFLDKAFIIIDKNKNSYFIILKPKESIDLETLAYEFYSQLISEYSIKKQLEKTEEIRKRIIEQALSNYIEPEQLKMEEEAYCEQEAIKEEVDRAMTSFRKEENIPENVEDLFIEDPLGIATPWELKYGKKDDQNK